MSYEISEALYAGASTIGDLGSYRTPKVFTELYNTVLNALRGDKVFGSGTAAPADTLKSGFLREIAGKGQGTLYDDLAGAISAVEGTRNAIGMGVPERIYLTGNSWHSDISAFKVPAAGMDDYNSSDVVLKYAGNHFVGISLKKKRKMGAASPPLTNAAFSSFLKSDSVRQLQERVEEIRYKFFANIIWKACQETGKDSPFWSDIAQKDLLECGEAGPVQTAFVDTGEVHQKGSQKGKPITEKYEYRLPKLGVDPKTGPTLAQAKLIMNMKVNVWRWSVGQRGWKRDSVPLINLKDVGHVRDLNPTMKGLPSEKSLIRTRWRNYVNRQLYGDSTLWTDFVDVLNGKDEHGKPIMINGKPFSTYMAETLLTRALKLDLKKVLEGVPHTFDFYLVEGVGDAKKSPVYEKADKNGDPIEGETTLNKEEAARKVTKTVEGGKNPRVKGDYTKVRTGSKPAETGDFLYVPEIGKASVVEAETLLEKINDWCGTGCTNEIRLEKGSAEAASAEFGLYMTSSTGKTMKALHIILRYGGTFTSHPRFHATMTQDFKNEFKTKDP